MKIRFLLALVGLAISFALPTFAQQNDTAASQIDEQIVKKLDVAFNNGDAAAVAALFTEDAVWVDSPRTCCRSGGHREAVHRDVPARALQQPSQQGRSGFPSHDRNGW